MKLHGYFRSSASFRVRIALNLKQLPYEAVSHDIAQRAHREPAYLALNPQGLVPTLEVDGAVLTQSLAIVEYLDARYPEPPLFPADPSARARVTSLAASIAADIHPLGTVRVARYLSEQLGADPEAVLGWQRHWAAEGLRAFEQRLQDGFTGRFSHGDTPGVADLFLVPQVVTARRAGVDIDAYPTIARIVDTCLEVPAFRHALPENQPDKK